MITEKDLREAIAECEGRRHPDASTCVKLAAFYTILNNMTEKGPEQKTRGGGYSFQAAPGIRYGKTEFSKLVKQKGIETAWPIIEEIMEALAVVEPKLYSNALRKLSDI